MTVFLLYEVGHIKELERFWREQPQESGSLVVALTPFVEEVLVKKGITFVSGRNYRPADMGRFLEAESWVARMADSPQWKWFQYRDVSLSQLFSFSIQFYLVQLLYYGTSIENIFIKHPSVRRLVVFPSFQTVPLKGRALARKQIEAIVACARLVATRHGVEVIVPRMTPAHIKRADVGRYYFTLKQAFAEAGMWLFNVFITFARPRGAPRILASDYWRNIAPVMSQLPHGELILFDRTEALNAGIRNLWRFKVRLFNLNSFPVRHRSAEQAETQKRFEEQWRDLRKNGLPECSAGGTSLHPMLAEMLDEIILHETPLMLRNIDSAYEMLQTLAPDIVFLRVSVTTQTHFAILAMVARALSIPSLELQHGLEYLGPGSISKHHSAEYVAVYGRVIQDEFAALGRPREKTPIVGSPRFDVYKNEAAAVQHDAGGADAISILCIGYGVGVEWFYDDYEMEDYYAAIARAVQNIPNASVVIKLRPGEFRESDCRSVIERIFAHVPHTIAQYEPMSELLSAADVVFSYYSTVVLEAMQFGKPVIAYSAQTMEKEQIRFHLTRYADRGGLIIAETPAEIEAACRSLAGDPAVRRSFERGAKEALAEFHLFGGRASERIVELIKTLAKK